MASPPSLPPGPAALSPRQLFWGFSQIALQGFGGVLAVAQRELVERRGWLSKAEFVDDWSAAQVLPGPNVVNLALMFGDRHCGLRGALAGAAGLLLFPLLLLLTLTLVYAQLQHLPAVQGALRGMGAVAAGLIAATALKLIGALRDNVLGRAWAGLAALAVFTAVAWLRWPLPWVLLGIGGPVCLLAGRRLAPQPRGEGPRA